VADVATALQNICTDLATTKKQAPGGLIVLFVSITTNYKRFCVFCQPTMVF
jgi:hypothetical protein